MACTSRAWTGFSIGTALTILAASGFGRASEQETPSGGDSPATDKDEREKPSAPEPPGHLGEPSPPSTAVSSDNVEHLDMSPEESIEPDPEYETRVYADRPPIPRLPEHRAKSVVSREDMERRLPRSAPDAIRYEPGVFVQQTAHSQGSAFIRGLTGQQTLIMFDGIRLNNSTYRQGPNQYFFTLDSQTIDSLQVVRGGASTRYGSDALGGVVLAMPIEPLLRSGDGDFVTYDPHIRFKGGTADGEAGGRGQVHLTLGDSLAFYGGGGGRHVGMLQSGGIVYNPEDGERPLVPRFKDDNHTQLGTGFNEITGDGRIIYRMKSGYTLKLAAYAYRQFDGPRTDQCPAAFAPFDECLNYDEQFRTLVYGAAQGQPAWGLLKSFRATLSWQRQRERRTLRRPSARVKNIGRDSVDTFGATLTAKTQNPQVFPWLRLGLKYGVDTYFDLLKSAAWISFTDIDVTQQRSRGQYLDDSSYLYGGAFAEGTARLFQWLRLRAGGRFSWIAAQSPTDSDSGTRAIDQAWFPLVGNAGLEWHPTSWLRLLANIDRSFRAPNLDDMTSRQQTGPGFQFENPDLKPESATTMEAGARVVSPVVAELWAFRTRIDGAVIKSPRQDSDCPPATPRCQASWSRFQLANANEQSEILGLEASLFSRLPWGFEGRTTVAWTWGEGPNVGDPPSDPSIPYDERVPLSRIPPLNGTAELSWSHDLGFSLSGSLRWATTQDRLALSDISDERIPRGGTPGFAVFDLRANYRIDKLMLASLALENVVDAAYRYHGSSVNGPGRGLVFLVDLGPLWFWTGQSVKQPDLSH